MTNERLAEEFIVVSDLSHHCYFNLPDLMDVRSRPEIPHGRRVAAVVERICRRCDAPFLTAARAAKFCSKPCREAEKWEREKKARKRRQRPTTMRMRPMGGRKNQRWSQAYREAAVQAELFA